MGEILEKMVQADVIVLATPVYFYSLSGQLKTLIDRTLPQYTQISNKDFYFMATAAAGKKSMERTMDALRGLPIAYQMLISKDMFMVQAFMRRGKLKIPLI